MGNTPKSIAVFLPIINRMGCRYNKVGVHNSVSAIIRGKDSNMKFSEMERQRDSQKLTEFPVVWRLRRSSWERDVKSN